MAKAEPDMHEGALRGENARLQEALRFAEQERDAARATNKRLNRRCGDYERALAEKRSLCSDGKPRGSNLSRALLSAYVSELRAAVELFCAGNDALRELAWRWCIEAAEQQRGRLLAECERDFERAKVAELRLEVHQLRGAP